MNVHFCPLDAECRKYGAPWRLYIGVGRWSISIGARSQAWYPWSGMTKKWRPITVHPDLAKLCGEIVQFPSGGHTGCSRLPGHRGPHRGPDWGPRG